MFKYTVKLLAMESKVTDNDQVPIYIRITIKRKSSFIATGHNVPLVLWDEKKERVKDGFALAASVNGDITSRKQKVIQKLAEIQVKGESITAAQAKLFFSGGDHTNIFQFATFLMKEVEDKREGGTMSNYTKHLGYLEAFHGSRNLSFQEMDHNYLCRFEKYLRARPKVNGENYSTNYLHLIFQTIRSFFNAAKKREIIFHYPFATFEMPEYIPPDKAYLDFEELDTLEAYADQCTDQTRRETSTYILLGAYSGLRVGDWHKFNIEEHLKDNRLRLRAKKNKEWVTMRVIGRLARHIERIRRTPLTVCVHEMNRTLKEIAVACGIKKKLTTHVGRHTFAITMCAEQGISAETCSELMGITIKTCVENYYKVTNRKIDKETECAWEGL